MAALPYIQLYVADYLADTAHLSTLEHGAYLLLIFNYWQRGESFKGKDEQSLNKRLTSVARMSNEEFNAVKSVLSEFFEISETEWRHERIERDLVEVNSKSSSASRAGKASAAKRAKLKQEKEESNAEVNERLTDVERSFNHTNTNTNTNTNNNALNEKSVTISSEEKKKRRTSPAFDFPDFLKPHRQLWDAYLETRKSKRVPNTLTAMKLCIDRLERLLEAGHSPDKVLSIAVERGWAGLEYAEAELLKSKAAPEINQLKNQYRGKNII